MFFYCFDEKIKDILVKQGFKLIGSDFGNQKRWLFEKPKGENEFFNLNKTSFLITNRIDF